jgi:hypothetical protein
MLLVLESLQLRNLLVQLADVEANQRRCCGHLHCCYAATDVKSALLCVLLPLGCDDMRRELRIEAVIDLEDANAHLQQHIGTQLNFCLEALKAAR